MGFKIEKGKASKGLKPNIETPDGIL